MISIKVRNPLEFWEKLGEIVLSDQTKKGSMKLFDLKIGKRRISYDNRIEIDAWPSSFEAKALYWAVGYELHGNKMSHLVNAYIDEEQFKEFQQVYEDKKLNSHFSVGIHFKRRPAGKGGCLSTFEIVGDRKMQTLFLHSKTMEFPKKGTADIRLCSLLLERLGIKTIRVVWYLPVIWYSEHFLKGIRTVFGNSYFQSLLGKKKAKELTEYMPGYVEPTQQRIKNHYKKIHPFEQDSGMKISEVTGEREKTRS